MMPGKDMQKGIKADKNQNMYKSIYKNERHSHAHLLYINMYTNM